MAVVTMRQLLESGVHFGHQTRRWNPKMKRFIFTERNGIYIIDLQQSLSYIDNAYEYVKNTVAKGGTILFVGTKRQAQEPIEEQAKRVGMPYVNQRWLGGMLTNFQTIHQRLNRMKELEEIDFDDVSGSGRTKKELLQMRREYDKLSRTLGGVRDMAKVPSAIWVVDTKKEHLAVDEAKKLGIPVIAILDTNCDPDDVDYPIPGNDDAIRSVGLLTRVFADAVAEGLLARGGAKTGQEEAGEELGGDEPLAEWERELLTTTEAAPTDASAQADEQPSGAVAAAAVEPETVETSTAPAEPAPAETAAEEPVAADTAASEPKAEAAAPAEAPEKAPGSAEGEADSAGADLPEGAAASNEDGSQPDGYPIKGNAQSKKFHQPGGRWYDQTTAEVWFDTAESAEKAGYTEAGK